jgi:FtsZ-interacting cell division protein ZipA
MGRILLAIFIAAMLIAGLWTLVRRSRISKKEAELETLQEETVVLDYDEAIKRQREEIDERRRKLLEEENGTTDTNTNPRVPPTSAPLE